MDKIRGRGGDFVLQVKKNCPAPYEEVIRLFDELEEEQKAGPEKFRKKYGDNYSKAESHEKNRERYEHRVFRSCSGADGIKAFQEERPHVVCVGRSDQVRINVIQDAAGNDITPDLAAFLKEGSGKQP